MNKYKFFIENTDSLYRGVFVKNENDEIVAIASIKYADNDIPIMITIMSFMIVEKFRHQKLSLEIFKELTELLSNKYPLIYTDIDLNNKHHQIMMNILLKLNYRVSYVYDDVIELCYDGSTHIDLKDVSIDNSDYNYILQHLDDFIPFK